MSEIKIGIPLNGKMAARTFHQQSFQQSLASGGLKPLYFLAGYFFDALNFDSTRYFELQVDVYEEQYQKYFFLQQLRFLRRFSVVTETTDLRFREAIEAKLFDATLPGMAAQMLYVWALRSIPRIGELLSWLERQLYFTDVHNAILKEQEVQCVLAPGMGNFGFWNEGSFAIEAKNLGIPAFAFITNYDNIVNMGYRSFNPTCLGVWSRQMADEAIRLHGFKSNQIEITGPVQYDRFMQPLSRTREEFLLSIGLDPNKKTVLFAGGVNINHYFDMYQTLVERKEKIWHEPFNLVVRPYPHVKLLGSPAWIVLEKCLRETGAYISNPGSIDASGGRAAEFQLDFTFGDEADELNYLLRCSDVMVNYFSTIGLEAAICDLPVIHVGYDAFAHGQRYGVTSAFLQRQTHNQRPLRLAAARVARNEKELIHAIEAYLKDPALEREMRKTYAESECGFLDGQSGMRVVQMIKSRL